MFDAYRKWADDNSGENLTKIDLGKRLLRLGYTESKSGGVRVWTDVTLIGQATATP